MSNDQPAESKPAPSAQGTSPVRLVILLLIFGVALAGLLYDYTIARPGQKKALDEIEALLKGEKRDPGGDGTVSDDEVQRILGCKPSEVENLVNGKIEIYLWRSGLPTRSHKLYVVYLGKTTPLLHSVSTSRPEKGQLPPVTKMAKEPTQEEIDSFVPKVPSAASMGGGVKNRAKSKDSDDAEEPPKKQDSNEDPPVESDTTESEDTKKEDVTEEPKTVEPPAKKEGGDES